jgi:hypothetical protein
MTWIATVSSHLQLHLSFRNQSHERYAAHQQNFKRHWHTHEREFHTDLRQQQEYEWIRTCYTRHLAGCFFPDLSSYSHIHVGYFLNVTLYWVSHVFINTVSHILYTMKVTCTVHIGVWCYFRVHGCFLCISEGLSQYWIHYGCILSYKIWIN